MGSLMQRIWVDAGKGVGGASGMQSPSAAQLREHQPPRQKPGLSQSVSLWQQPPGPRGGALRLPFQQAPEGGPPAPPVPPEPASWLAPEPPSPQPELAPRASKTAAQNTRASLQTAIHRHWRPQGQVCAMAVGAGQAYV